MFEWKHNKKYKFLNLSFDYKSKDNARFGLDLDLEFVGKLFVFYKNSHC